MNVFKYERFLMVKSGTLYSIRKTALYISMGSMNESVLMIILVL